MVKTPILVCSKCQKVRKQGEWVRLTALDVLQLKERPNEWELVVTICDECYKTSPEPVDTVAP